MKFLNRIFLLCFTTFILCGCAINNLNNNVINDKKFSNMFDSNHWESANSPSIINKINSSVENKE